MMREIINKIAFLSLFLDNLYIPLNLGFDFRVNYIFHFIYILYYFLTFKKIKIHLKGLFLFFFIFFLFSLVPLIKGISVIGFFKQITLISFNLLFCLVLINAYNYDLRKIFKDYLSIVTCICIIAIIQYISLKIGFIYGADYSFLGFNLGNFNALNQVSVQAWFEEPSFLVYSITPAVFISISRLFNLNVKISKTKAVLIVFSLLLTGSSIFRITIFYFYYICQQIFYNTKTSFFNLH